MKYLLLLFISFAIYCCSGNNDSAITKEELKSSTNTSILADSAFVTSLEEEVEQEVECVFDSSTFKFTTEALKKYDKNLAFHWDKQTSNALVKLNNTDSLILQIGGCNHFTYSATYITEARKFDDREFLVEKAKWLAKNFFSNGFDEKYVSSIENNLYKLEEPKRKNFLYYTIIDTDTVETDHVYEGWTIEKVGSKTRLNLVGYQN